MDQVLKSLNLGQALFTLLVTLISVLAVRVKVAAISREELSKTLDELREQIADRDRTLIGIREEVKTLTSRVEYVSRQYKQQQDETLALLSENLTLKAQLKRLQGGGA